MSIKKGLIKNTAFNLGGYVYLLLASFFSISILLNNLGRDRFGAYLLLSAIVPLLSVFDLGISTAEVRDLSLPSNSNEEKKRVWQTSFFLYLVQATILAIAAFIILLVMSGNTPALSVLDRSTLMLSTILISVTVFINHINNHLLNLPQANQRFDIFNSKTLLVGSANTVFAALLSQVSPHIEYLFLLQLVFHLITSIFMIKYCFSQFLSDFWPKLHIPTMKSILNFGFKNFIGTLAGQVEVQFSKYALGSMVSAFAITAYSIPQNIVVKGAGVVSQVAQAVFPLSASLLEKDRIGKLKKLILWLQALVFLGGLAAITLTLVIGKQFLTWWLKDPVVVEAAFPVLKILSVYFMLASLTPIPTVVVQSIGKPQIPSLFAVLTTTIEIVASLIFIPRLGVTGAAYGALISSIITVPSFLTVCWILFQREFKKTVSSTYVHTPTSLT